MFLFLVIFYRHKNEWIIQLASGKYLKKKLEEGEGAILRSNVVKEEASGILEFLEYPTHCFLFLGAQNRDFSKGHKFVCLHKHCVK